MGTKDLHDKPFDETTIVKLQLFENYTKAWLPTFLMSKFVRELHVFDFFAGTGYDKDGVPGSPIRLLQKVIEQKDLILDKGIRIVLHLNEFDKTKINQLELACEELQKNLSPTLLKYVNVNYYNEDFEILFSRLKDTINKHPSLVFLDQNGIKFISDKYFMELEKMKQTDFLYFLSSSYFTRFGNRPEFQIHLDLDIEHIKRQGYKKIHRSICEQIKLKLPIPSSLKIYPFSLKKGVNIHGVIFGAKHPRAVDKFLRIAWDMNPINGDANFDIDDEANLGQIDMFSGERMSKIESFKKEVRDKILSREITNNKELLIFAYDKGHIGKHAHDCVIEMKKKKEIAFESRSPLVTYENVFKNNKIIQYEKI